MKNDVHSFDKAFRKEIYQNMIDEQEKQSLIHTLVRMQTEKGISRETAVATAEVCIAAVSGCERVRGELSGGNDALVEALLEEAAKSNDRDLILHKLYFGLVVYPDLAAADGKLSAEELFWRYYTQNKETKGVETLKEEIRGALTDYRLTPEVMQALVKKMEGSGDYLATASALGEGGISFKCIAAMELYLNDQDNMTIYEAANIACAGVELQATADAVGQGMITRDMAKKILIIAGITLAVVGLGIMIYYSGSAAALAKGAANVADKVMVMPEIFSEFASYRNAAGAPVFIIETADTIFETVYKPLIEAAKHKEMIGRCMVALGAAAVALSKKTADLIGKFRAGFTTEKEQLKAGLQQLAGQQQLRQETPEVKTDRQTVREEEEEIRQHQARPATQGAK